MDRLTTTRLTIAPFTEDDAAFALELLNDPGWLRFIGDKHVSTLDDARAYLRNGPIASVARHGFGLARVARRSDGVAIGMCGLIRRDGLDDVDLGFAFLPAGRGQDHAREAAGAVLTHGLRVLGLPRIVAITALDNAPSARVLEGIGMRFERVVRLPGGDEDLKLYVADAATA